MRAAKILTIACLAVASFAISGFAQNVSRESWIQQFTLAFPVYVCKEYRSIYVDKYKSTLFKCEKLLGMTTSACIEVIKADIPDPLHQPDDGKNVGIVIGNCAGELYEKAMQYRSKG